MPPYAWHGTFFFSEKSGNRSGAGDPTFAENQPSMNRYLLLYALVLTGLVLLLWPRQRAEIRRLTQNQSALASQVSHYRTRLDEEAASAQVLRLRAAEFEELRAADAERIRQMGIRIRRLEAASKSVTATRLELHAPLRETVRVALRDTLVVRDTVRLFRWRDAWVTVEGMLRDDSVACRVESVDTLRQVVHRIPRRFLFIRWGTKALRQEIVSSNPHTRIVYTEQVRIER